MSAAKLPILNPNEFDLWKMRIEQYFLMTDYSLWEVILNGDSPAPTRLLKVLFSLLILLLLNKEKRFGGNKETNKVQKTLRKQQYENFTGSSSESLDQIHDRLQKLINLKDQSLDELFNSLKIYEVEVKSSSFASTSTQNIAFVSYNNTDNTNEPISVVASVSAVSAKIPVSVLPNVDSLSNAEMNLKWQMAMLTVRARKGHFAKECRSPKDTRRNGAVEPQKRNVSVETSTSNALVSQCDGVGSYDWSFQAEEEPTNYALMAFPSSSSSSSDNELRDNALVVLKQKFKKAKQERDDLKLKLEKFQTFSNNLNQLLASQTNDKIGLGYNTQVFTSYIFDCDDMFTSETDESLHASPIYDRYQSGVGYHVVPPPHTGTFMPPKPDLVFNDAPNVNETVHTAFNVELSPTKPDKELSHRPSTPIIEDWPTEQVKPPRPSINPVETYILATNHQIAIPKPKSHENSRNRKACFVCKSLTHLIKDCDYYEKKMAQKPVRNHAQRGNHQQYARMTLPNPQRHVVPTTVLTKSKLVPITVARQVTATVPTPYVTIPRQAKNVVTKPYSPPRRHINRSSSPKASIFPPKVIAAKAPMVNVVKGNMSYLSDFEELNGGYVAFGANPKGGKISGKDTECIVLSPEFKLLDENQVLLRVSRENNTYNVDLKNIVPSGDLTCLFAKATLDESNLWHRRSDNGTEFKNNDLNQFCGMKGIRREFSVPRTPQQNKIAERKNMTLIEAAKTMLADSLLPIPFWAEAVNTACSSPTWLFDIDTLTKTMNYQPVTAGNQSNPSAGVQEQFNVEKAGGNVQQYVLFPVWSSGSNNPQNTDLDVSFEVKEPEFERRKPQSEVHVSPSNSAQSKKHDDKTKKEAKGKSPVELSTGYRNLSEEFEDFSDNSINEVNVVDSPVLAVGQIFTNSTNTFRVAGPSNTVVSPTHRKSSYMDASQYPDDPNMPELEDITHSDDEEDVGAEADFTNLETSITVSPIPTTRVRKDHHVTQIIGDLSSATQTRKEPKRVHQALKDPSWIEALQEELLQFKMQKEEGIDYKEVFAPVVRIEAIRLFLAYASFMGFMLYQMDVKSAFLYETIKEERGKIDQTLFIKRQKCDILLVQIYVDDIIFGSTNKDLCKSLEKLMKDKFQMSSMGELTFFLGLQVKQKQDGIFISQDKYIAEILRKFDLTGGKSTSTLIDTEKPLLKDPDGEDVDVHTYRSMIGSLMYLTSSRPDIIYLKGKPHLGLWYPKDSPFNLVAYSDSDYAGASLDKKSTTGVCQFLGCRLMSWQCKKQTIVATSSTEAEYVAAAKPKSKDKGKGIMVEDPKPLKKQAQIEQDEAYARELEAELNKIINWDDVIDHVQRKEKEDTAMMRYQALKRKPQTESQAKKNMMIYLRNMAGFKMDYFKGMSYDNIRLIFEKKFNSNMAFLQKTREQMEEEDNKLLKRTRESQAEIAAKKQKLDEEVDELKKHL
uniref:Integrase catalytic domain-containing protein n=1 Tax=Tanacetum cinerariifolium TaxID=118510 RepID=A0A6L2KV40_TANCI|nr:hypothetical protein [Tanacetum cinerariifolium]